MSAGKSVRLFLADGTPGGLLTAEIMNWTGHVIAAPRSDLAALLGRPEVTRTGVYLLLGDDPDRPGEQIAYVGEGDDVSKRLLMHARPEASGGKDFWARVVVLTSKDANLTKAHARYLEARFLKLATEANRVRLVNGTAPLPILLPEADLSDMEYFISQARIVLPVLGVNLLRSTTSPPIPGTSGAVAATDSPVFTVTQARDHVEGFAQEVDGEFTVRAGSRARRTWSGAEISTTKLRRRLEEDGVLVPSSDDVTMEFPRDHVFSSPSAASAVLLGRSSNGRSNGGCREQAFPTVTGSSTRSKAWTARYTAPAERAGHCSSKAQPIRPRTRTSETKPAIEAKSWNRSRLDLSAMSTRN